MEGVLNCMAWYIDPSPFPLVFSRSKNLTAEVAEHAEGQNQNPISKSQISKNNQAPR
jgi:hypothetical protein